MTNLVKLGNAEIKKCEMLLEVARMTNDRVGMVRAMEKISRIEKAMDKELERKYWGV